MHAYITFWTQHSPLLTLHYLQETNLFSSLAMPAILSLPCLHNMYLLEIGRILLLHYSYYIIPIWTRIIHMKIT